MIQVKKFLLPLRVNLLPSWQGAGPKRLSPCCPWQGLGFAPVHMEIAYDPLALESFTKLSCQTSDRTYKNIAGDNKRPDRPHSSLNERNTTLQSCPGIKQSFQTLAREGLPMVQKIPHQTCKCLQFPSLVPLSHTQSSKSQQ